MRKSTLRSSTRTWIDPTTLQQLSFLISEGTRPTTPTETWWASSGTVQPAKWCIPSSRTESACLRDRSQRLTVISHQYSLTTMKQYWSKASRVANTLLYSSMMKIPRVTQWNPSEISNLDIQSSCSPTELKKSGRLTSISPRRSEDISWKATF